MGGGRLGPARLLAALAITLAVAVACTSQEPADPTPTGVEADATVTPSPTPEPSPTASPEPTMVATATPTVTPAPTPTATRVPATPTPTPSPTPTSEPAARYANDLYGFSVQYPNSWSVEETDSPVLVAVFDTGTEGLSARAYVSYYRDRLSAPEAAEQELAGLAGLANFRTIVEGPVTLENGAETYQVLYGFGTGAEERRGGLTFLTEHTRAMIFQVVGPRRAYEENLPAVDGFLNGVSLEEQRPFGVPREDALVLALDDGPSTLDPAIAHESRSIQYVNQIFRGLVALDDELNVVPNLAESWEVSDNGLTYTFTIDEDAAFHDGSPVLASDIAYSWERAAGPELESPVVGTYLGDIVGFAERASGAAESISGLEVVNDRTLRVTIDSRKSYFLSKLAHTVASVVQRGNVESGEGTWWLEPVGTGPFAVAEYIPDVAMHLRRHERYHGTVPEVPNVIFRFYSGLPMRMFEDGEIDAALISRGEFKALEEEGSEFLESITTRPLLSVHYVGFNTAVPPFEDVNVRRAFLFALDRKAIVEETLEGIGVLAQGFLPPDLPGYDSAIEDIRFTAEAARTALQSSTYGSADALPEIVFTVPALRPHIVQMTEMWKEHLGVSVQIDVVPGDDYYYNLSEHVQGLFTYGWIADYPDPHNFLDVLFHSEGGSNAGEFRNPTVDGLLVQARTETDPEERFRLYRTAERILVANGAAVPLWFGQARVLAKPYVEGFSIDAQGKLDLDGVSLTER